MDTSKIIENKNILFEYLTHLEQKGLNFSCWINGTGHDLSVEEAFQYSLDSDGFIAEYYNIPIDKYKRGKELFLNRDAYYFRCCALNKNKKRCKAEINLREYRNEIDFTCAILPHLDKTGSLCELHAARLKSSHTSVHVLPINLLESSNYD